MSGPPPQPSTTGIRRARWRRTPGRGQVAAVDWSAAERAAVRAELDGTIGGLRDAALLGCMSDALLRVSEAAALDVGDVQRQPDGSGTLTVRRSKTDQTGRGHVRYLGPPTVARVAAYLHRAGHDAGAAFRAVRSLPAHGAEQAPPAPLGWRDPTMPARYTRHQTARRGAVARLRYGAGRP